MNFKLEDAAARLEALGNPTRLGVYRLLVRAGDGGLPVGRLQRRLKIAPSTLSHHLRGLIEVGLVAQERQGTTLVCRANYQQMKALISFLADECCADEQANCAPSTGRILLQAVKS
jgi:ArsR family transcriptional regulator, arsenate/arsenite/antimonite-responsive transcriptional repressor